MCPSPASSLLLLISCLSTSPTFPPRIPHLALPIKRIPHTIEVHIRNARECIRRDKHEINRLEIHKAARELEQLLLRHRARDQIRIDGFAAGLGACGAHGAADGDIDAACCAAEADGADGRGDAGEVEAAQGEVVDAGAVGAD